jgi:hypothetical protein
MGTRRPQLVRLVAPAPNDPFSNERERKKEVQLDRQLWPINCQRSHIQMEEKKYNHLFRGGLYIFLFQFVTRVMCVYYQKSKDQ